MKNISKLLEISRWSPNTQEIKVVEKSVLIRM